MGRYTGFTPGKIHCAERAIRWAIAVPSAIGFIVALSAAVFPFLRNWLQDLSTLPIFDTEYVPQLGDLSVLLLTYVFLTLSRQKGWDFVRSVGGFLLSFGFWFFGTIGVEWASTLALLVAVGTVILSAALDEGQVWIWTDVPEPSSEFPTASESTPSS